MQHNKGLYTVNLYNTNCKCLVNGRDVDSFARTAFPKLLEEVEAEFEILVIASFDDSMGMESEGDEHQTRVLKPYTATADAQKSEGTPSLDTSGCEDVVTYLYPCTVCTGDADVGGAVGCDKCKKWTHKECSGTTTREYKHLMKTKTPYKCPACDTELISDSIDASPNNITSKDQCLDLDSDLRTMVEEVHSAIIVLTTVLNEHDHINKTNNKLSQLKDEIHSIKTCIKINTDRLNDNIESLASKNNEGSRTISGILGQFERRLQAITDCVKNIPREIGSISNNQTTSNSKELTTCETLQ